MASVLPFKSPSGNTHEADGSNALDRLTALVAEDLAAVDRVMDRLMESRAPLVPELAGYLVRSGGKRLRPILALAAAKLCGYEGERHHKLAACVELLHSATLLHDDVVDASKLRRGATSANAAFGNQASVLVGDFLLSRAFQLMVEDGSLEVLRILSNAATVIAEGEVLQLATNNNCATSEQTYLEIAAAKTAELFAASCRTGAVIADRPAAEEEALRTFGLNLGIAFQIVDDILDYTASQEQFGKPAGGDFREGKVTLPVILAMNRGNEAERAFWRRTLEEHRQSEGDLAHAQNILRSHHALRDCLDRARHYSAIARDALGLFADQPLKKALLDVVHFSVERGF